MGKIILPEGQFSTIVTDPPWRFKDSNARGAAEKQYKTMSDREILRMDVESLALPQAYIYCWVTDSHLELGLQCLRMWGFDFKQHLTWVKAQNGKLQMGAGHYFRHADELILFGTRGRAKTLSHSELNVFWAPRTRGHSEKPEELQDMVERMSPGPYVELFARRDRPGWVCWGDDPSLAMNQAKPEFNCAICGTDGVLGPCADDCSAQIYPAEPDEDPQYDQYGAIANVD